MALQTGLEGKAWYVGAIVGLVAAAVIFFLGHRFLLDPKNKELARKENRLEDLQAKINEGRVAQRQLPEFREEVRRLEVKLDKLLRILPARRNTPELLRRVKNLAEQGNLDVNRFRPQGFVDRDFYSEWPIAIDLQGSYHNLALLFDRISRISRIINIEDLKIKTAKSGKSGGGDQTISAVFKAKTFVYKEAEPEDDVSGSGGS